MRYRSRGRRGVTRRRSVRRLGRRRRVGRANRRVFVIGQRM